MISNTVALQKARILSVCAIAALSVCSLEPAWAEVTPRAGKHDARVRHVTYVEGQVYRINTRLKTATLIEFDKGEVVTTVPIGDSNSFLIEEINSKNALMVKPLVSGARTNAIVETNRRFYLLEIYESGNRQPYYSVQFNVPKAAKPASARSAVLSQPYSYRVEKTKSAVSFKPLSVWDDGQKTHFTFGPDAPIPAVFRADQKGREYVVNSAANGTTVTVTKRSERWVLRHGEEFVCITADTGGTSK